MPFSSVVFCVSVPENPPVNVTAALNGTEVLMTWEGPPGKLNGELQGYMVEYSTPAAQQVSPWHNINTAPTWSGCRSCLSAQKIFPSHKTDKSCFVVHSSLWIPDWTLSCQSICPYPCPMCLSEFAPIRGQGRDPGPPHRLWPLLPRVSDN